METAVITGASGFVGSHLVDELLNRGYHVIALVQKGFENQMKNRENVTTIGFELDNVMEIVEILKNLKPKYFYHFAWAGPSGEARADTKLQLQNAQWTIDCIRLAKEVGCERFINAGSIMESETWAAITKAGNKPGLGYIYGSAKLVAHAMAMPVAASIGIDLIWAQITNTYGVGELSPRMVNTTLRKVIRGEAPQFTAGTQHYDFVYIDDVARAFYLIGKNGKPFNSYLIGSGKAKALKEFLIEMKESVAPDLDFIFGDIPFTGVDLPLSEFDCSKTEKDTGFKAEISFSEGTRRTIEWLKEEEK
ncbi:MAG: NAD(P)-dependent oxidoreductase [Streptococcaceae bacterium]|jgi:nucleoside-diphosphate-sugar epimerase|nr:NAD(P)-dependent oxidoreductase [Streptococcaceae bacterium]